eukprot:scaffold3851_cov387-Prasinococcus_capsulatus_cf.AAC.1
MGLWFALSIRVEVLARPRITTALRTPHRRRRRGGRRPNAPRTRSERHASATARTTARALAGREGGNGEGEIAPWSERPTICRSRSPVGSPAAPRMLLNALRSYTAATGGGAPNPLGPPCVLRERVLLRAGVR